MNRYYVQRYKVKLVAVLGLILGLPEAGLASIRHQAHPARAEAAVMGRDEIYNAERFLHELSYAHRSPVAVRYQEGIWGTAGSASW